MYVANIKLCKELYELSGWLCHFAYGASGKVVLYRRQALDRNRILQSPAYGLGELLRKMPHHLNNGQLVLDIGVDVDTNVTHADRYWLACYAHFDDLNKGEIKGYGPTPEDAVCQLAIELYKSGILK